MSKPKNVILIVADSLRYDSVYNEEADNLLPYISSKAVEFSQARSSGCWTLPATSSIFTGKLPHEHGATSQTRSIDLGLPTLAEHMKEAGYHTHQVTANVATTHIFGLHRGFDSVKKIWEIVPAKFNKLQQFLVLVGKPRLRKKLLSKDAIMHDLSQDMRSSATWLQHTHSDTFKVARDLLKVGNEDGKGTFLFLNLMESHFPYHVAPTFETSVSGIRNKIREVQALFHTVNQTFLKDAKLHVKPDMLKTIRKRQRKSWELLAPSIDAFVKELHQDQDNLVVFLSDHGDNFGEDSWLYHFSNVTDAGTRVPLFWLAPDGTQKKGKVNTAINSKDLYRSLLHAVGRADRSTEPSLLDEPEASIPVLQSYWYNNHGQTLEQFKYNQLCFVEGDTRYLYRKGVWYSAGVAKDGHEPLFERMSSQTDPIEEVVQDAARKRRLQKIVSEFDEFSTKVVGSGDIEHILKEKKV